MEEFKVLTEEEKEKLMAEPARGCNHEWRVIPDFFDGSRGRDIRTYPFYCVRCLESKTVTISRLKKSN